MSTTEQPVGLLRPLVEDLAERRERAKLGGGEEKIAKQHERGKLTARERLDLLIDEGTFCEFGLHAQPHSTQVAMAGRDAPADGENVTQEELGGSRVHCRVSGVGDMEVESDEECIAVIKEYLSFFPSHNQEPPPIMPADDPVDRMDEELLDVLPESNRKPYDMYDVVSA